MRQIYEGDEPARLRMAQEVRKLKLETEELEWEQRSWLSLESDISAEDNTERDAFIACLGDYLSEALPARLNPRQLDVLLMHGINELTYKEIGERMNISDSRAHEIMEQVRIQLREYSFRNHVFYPE